MKRSLCLVVLVMLLGCGPNSELEDLSCGAFHDFAVDVTDGVVSPFEYRGRLKEIADRAVGSTVESEARDLLAAYTTHGTGSEFDSAVRSMSSACDAYRD